MGGCNSQPQPKIAPEAPEPVVISEQRPNYSGLKTLGLDVAQKIFKKFDEDGSGAIQITSVDALTKLLEEIPGVKLDPVVVQKIFSFIDKEALYNLQQCCQLLYIAANCLDGYPIEKLAFMVADKECKGQITLSDVRNIMGRIGKAVSPEAVQKAVQRARAGELLDLESFTSVFYFL